MVTVSPLESFFCSADSVGSLSPPQAAVVAPNVSVIITPRASRARPVFLVYTVLSCRHVPSARVGDVAGGQVTEVWERFH
ncbi:hypothetical protein GCM10027026_45180 [Myroides odoratimimus subsp. xuanwuensis]